MDRLKKLVCYPRGPRASRASPWTWVRLSTPICWVERAISNDVSYMSVVLILGSVFNDLSTLVPQIM